MNIKANKEKFLEYLASLGLDLSQKQIYQKTDTAGKNSFNNGIEFLNAEEAWSKLSKLNEEGVSISLAPNLFDGSGGRKKENVIGYRYVVIDHDSNEEIQFKIKPTAIIKTKRGFHYYLKIKKEDIHKLDELEKLAKSLAKIHKSDPSSGERNRAYRCAGFLHNKDINDLAMVEVIDSSNCEYSIEDLNIAYGCEFKIIESTSPSKVKKNFNDWYNDQPFHGGVRNSTLFTICGHAFNKGMTPSQVKEYVDDYIKRSGLSLEEGHNVFEKALKKNKLTPSDAKPKIYEVAQRFIETSFTDETDQLLLRYFSGDFYAYKNGVYKIIEHESFVAMVTKYIHTFDKLHDVSIKKYRGDVIATIQSNCLAPIELGKSFWLNHPIKNEAYICLKNGLLNVDKYLSGDLDCLIDHTSQYFTTNQLPFDFKFGASCPTWTSFLDSIFDEKEIITLLQCWFGYNLIPDTSFHKFLLLYGKGANGKSVITIILTALLGEENVSCLGLECFDQSKTFALGGLINKLANIVSEMNEVSKTSEGLLKSIVSGELISIDRKYREPISYRPTARLTFATNVLPRITDRSDGFPRRLILIPFEKQFLEESKQDRRLSSLKFWIESGELSGVFEWALQGLKLLKEKGSFEIPSKVQEAIDNYVTQSNPTFDYLKTHYTYSKDKVFSKRDAYSDYKGWMGTNGFNPLNANNFANEVRRAFPLVEASKVLHTFKHESIHSTSFRDRAWFGLTKKEDDGEQLDQ